MRTGAGERAVEAEVKEVLGRQKKTEADDRRERERAASKKVFLPAPLGDSEPGPVMEMMDRVLANSDATEPPMRDLSSWPTHVLEREAAGLHELTSTGANDEEGEKSRLPPPKQMLLTRHNQFGVEIEIGDHISFVHETDEGYQPVALAPRFLDHWLNYRRSKLPIVGAVLTMPLVLPDGTLLARNGLDRDRRLVMRCDQKMLDFIPRKRRAMTLRYLRLSPFLSMNGWSTWRRIFRRNACFSLMILVS